MAESIEREHETVEQIAATVAPDFLGVVAPETVKRLVAEAYARLSEDATVHTFVPLLTQRLARERLRIVVSGEGTGEAGDQGDA